MVSAHRCHNERIWYYGGIKVPTEAEIAKARAGIEKLYKDPKIAKPKAVTVTGGEKALDLADQQTLALDGRSFCLDVIQITGANRKGSKSYPSLNTSMYLLEVAISGTGGSVAGWTRVTVSGNTVSWTSQADSTASEAFIFVCQKEK
ncbi:hypothetical protein [Hafnia alvei]|uniref:hypothetical protein n=1 Tax=Hafnia alvei TaxID=569 RepID=UPI0006226264|nr:hypothetical protein [Hafnia alvei]KKI44946.1 hypothetical protein XK86_07595 [Hafnia alvei]